MDDNDIHERMRSDLQQAEADRIEEIALSHPFLANGIPYNRRAEALASLCTSFFSFVFLQNLQKTVILNLFQDLCEVYYWLSYPKHQSTFNNLHHPAFSEIMDGYFSVCRALHG